MVKISETLDTFGLDKSYSAQLTHVLLYSDKYGPKYKIGFIADKVDGIFK